jgi:hypothetical protein
MPEVLDAYFLVENRELKLVMDFMRYFGFHPETEVAKCPNREYIIGPQNVFLSAENALFFLEKNNNIDYSIYWVNRNNENMIRQFSVHFTDDGKVIYGLAIEGTDPESLQVIELFKSVRDYLHSKSACITSYEPPPSNSILFEEFCKNRIVPA